MPSMYIVKHVFVCDISCVLRFVRLASSVLMFGCVLCHSLMFGS